MAKLNLESFAKRATVLIVDSTNCAISAFTTGTKSYPAVAGVSCQLFRCSVCSRKYLLTRNCIAQRQQAGHRKEGNGQTCDAPPKANKRLRFTHTKVLRRATVAYTQCVGYVMFLGLHKSSGCGHMINCHTNCF